jgi:hypothetical protein
MVQAAKSAVDSAREKFVVSRPGKQQFRVRSTRQSPRREIGSEVAPLWNSPRWIGRSNATVGPRQGF